MQEIVQKQMMARGYTFGSPAAADVIVVINKLNADISEGSHAIILVLKQIFPLLSAC